MCCVAWPARCCQVAIVNLLGCPSTGHWIPRLERNVSHHSFDIGLVLLVASIQIRSSIDLD